MDVSASERDETTGAITTLRVELDSLEVALAGQTRLRVTTATAIKAGP